MKERILLVDDEPDMINFMRDALQDAGYEVAVAYDGESVFPMLEPPPDIVVLDVMMPGMSGFELCRKLRDMVDCPIVFLSARHAVSDRIEGLAIGGDDYLVKPFSIDELLARLQAHLRREQRGAQGKYDNRMLRFGELTISLQSYSMYYRGTPVKLTAREFEIVLLLVLRPGQVFSREQIYESVWGVDAVGDSSTITEHIKKIRAKMGGAGVAEDYISTVWGVGYRWDRR